MPMRNTRTTYGAVHRTLHWVIALLVLPQLIVGDIILLQSANQVPTLSAYVHPTVGILIGLLMVARLVWRKRNVMPTEPHDAGVPGITLSAFTHWAFYLLLILNPLIGYLLVSFQGFPVYFTVIPLPQITPTSPSFSAFFWWLHLFAGLSIGLLFLLHAGGALVHEFLLRDNVLRRMLGFPGMTQARAMRQETWPDGSRFVSKHEEPASSR